MHLAPDHPERPTDAELQRLNWRFRGRPPEELLGWAAEQFGERAALTCSFGGVAGMVLLDLVARHELPLAVILMRSAPNLICSRTAWRIASTPSTICA